MVQIRRSPDATPRGPFDGANATWVRIPPSPPPRRPRIPWKHWEAGFRHDEDRACGNPAVTNGPCLADAASGWNATFVFATVLLANLTGSNFGAMFIIAPVAVASAAAIGLDPWGTVIAVAFSALSSIILPLDTAIGLTFASGRCKMRDTVGVDRAVDDHLHRSHLRERDAGLPT